MSVNETLQLGDAIRVTVVVIRAGRVRLGIDYPRDDVLPRRID
jgi:sRNA-binding carbon storage regulator CsrA